MITRMLVPPRPRSEPEKPFWISFSDLMTALMVLFLVVMSVSLLSVAQALLNQQKQYQNELDKLHKQEAEQRRRREARDHNIQTIMEELQASAKQYADVTVSRDRLVIDFGEAARFASGSYRLTGNGDKVIRDVARDVLRVADTALGQRWIRRVVIEGFTDTDGSYLFNLDLSLKRAQSVVCALLRQASAEDPELSEDEQREVRALFLVGGFSFNSARASKDESRRVEFRLEFRALDEKVPPPPTIPIGSLAVGRCALP